MARKRMNPEWKTKWLKALRSGTYRQVTEQLTASGRYCCLGVLYDCLVKDGEASWDDPVKAYEAVIPYNRAELLDKNVLDIVGFTNKSQELLANFNDVHNMEFPAIADWVEANL